MREIHGHEINECNAAIRITADPIGNGGASHYYQMDWSGRAGGRKGAFFGFQDGPIKEVGTNGITHEVLLTIIKDRLQCFQAGEWACPENAIALGYINGALEVLHRRTRLRDERGVGGGGGGTWQK